MPSQPVLLFSQESLMNHQALSQEILTKILFSGKIQHHLDEV
jgi:hypothetical protein